MYYASERGSGQIGLRLELGQWAVDLGLWAAEANAAQMISANVVNSQGSFAAGVWQRQHIFVSAQNTVA